MNVLIVQERANSKPHQLRQAGITPIGLVEHGKLTRMMQAPTTLVRDALAHAKGIGMIDIQVEGEAKKRTVFVKHVDRIPHTPQILNVTLNEVTKGESVTIDVAVHPVGTPPEVARGTGVLLNPASTIKVKGKHSDLPSGIDVDVSTLEAGMSIHASDVPLPAGTELASSPDTTVFAVQHLRTTAPENEEAPMEAAETTSE